MEQQVIFIKTNMGNKVTFEYKDQIYFKNEKNEEKAINLVQLTVFETNDLNARFVDADHHGYLEKIRRSWRSIFTGSVEWVKYYYVLKGHILYIFEINNYDKPMQFLDISPLYVDQGKFKDYNRNNVILLIMGVEEPLALAAENEQ
jgi:hypothetical protein